MLSYLKYAGLSAILLSAQVAAFAVTQCGAVILTMDEVPLQPADGLTLKGVTFHFTVGGTPSPLARIHATNGGQLTFVQDPSLVGPANGVLTLDFASPVFGLQFGVARSTLATLSPGFQVQLFDSALNPIGTFPVDTQSLVGVSEGLFTAPANLPISRAVLTFPNSGTVLDFALDNVAFSLCPAEAFQVRYLANLSKGDSVINFTNAGTSSTAGTPAQNGNICVNVYAFSPDEQLVGCCSCVVTPNGLASLSARNDIIPNTLTISSPESLVIKLLASAGGLTSTGATSCNAAMAGSGRDLPTTGLAAYGTTIHALPVISGNLAPAYGVTETRFTLSQLSTAELNRITTLCGFNQVNGSGFGLCRSCRPGGLGASKF